MAHVRKEDRIDVGDEVEVDSGLRMRVAEVHGSEAVCVWLVRGEAQRGRFNLAQLRKIAPPEGPPFVRSAMQP
jgi:uncharacterized protein YodC (DUF2158 family)